MILKGTTEYGDHIIGDENLTEIFCTSPRNTIDKKYRSTTRIQSQLPIRMSTYAFKYEREGASYHLQPFYLA